jgi:ADP-heptose:LPS heptosyltransferase
MTADHGTALRRILVIKLGALGDFVQALGPMAAIRRRHPNAWITLLTIEPYAGFARAAPYFDEVWTDTRPSLGNLFGLMRLRRRLRHGRFERVYDLQTSDRSGFYYRLIGPGKRPEWSGIAAGCSHPHTNPDRDFMHTIERQREQLAMAGIEAAPAADLNWAEADLSSFGLDRPYVVLVPGGSAHRPAKRWPAERYGALAADLASKGVLPVIVGAPQETPLARIILAAAPQARDLTGRTDLTTIAALGRAASWVVGNDTGPVHLLAAAGAPCTVLFSAASNPAITAPRGARVVTISRQSLADLSAAEVAATLRLS